MGQEKRWAARSGREIVSLRPQEIPSAVTSDIAAVKLVSLLHVLGTNIDGSYARKTVVLPPGA